MIDPLISWWASSAANPAEAFGEAAGTIPTARANAGRAGLGTKWNNNPGFSKPTRWLTVDQC